VTVTIQTTVINTMLTYIIIIIIIIVWLVRCWMLPFLRACSWLVDSALNDSRLL